jgi:hypothetical protein
MRIGVVSDTHNHLRNVERIVELFDAAAVDHVVHTGDITQARTLEAFARLAMPFVGVYGNNDERPALEAASRALGLPLHEPPLSLAFGGTPVAVLHDPHGLDDALLARHALVLHGHNHRLVCERRHDALVFNPGECAGMMVGRNAVGVVDTASFAVELLRF